MLKIIKFRIWIVCALTALTLHLFTGAVAAEDEIVAFKVQAVLKSGMRCDAVISSKTLLPSIKKNEALDLSRFDPKSRISLFYLQGLNGSMTVPLKDIESLKGLKPLKAGELAEYKGKITQKIMERRTSEEAKGIEKKQDKTPAPTEETATTVETPKPPKPEPVEEKVLVWLKRFPIEEGWKPESKEELYHRGVTIGVFPDKNEQEFLDHYKEWMADYKVYQERKAEKVEKQDEVRKEKQAARTKWLKQFPVKEGWNPGRRILILRKSEDAGMKLDAKEQAFLDNFTEWNAEYNDWLRNR